MLIRRTECCCVCICSWWEQNTDRFSEGQVIPVIEPSQEMAFTAIPDLTIKSQIKYYSCAGVDMNPQMNKLAIGDNRVVRYDLEWPVEIRDLKYDSASDSILFGVKHYNPDGGPMSIKVASIHRKDNDKEWWQGTNHRYCSTSEGTWDTDTRN